MTRGTPLGPRGTHTSAGRWRSWIGRVGGHSNRVSCQEYSRFSQLGSKSCPVAGGREDVSDGVVAGWMQEHGELVRLVPQEHRAPSAASLAAAFFFSAFSKPSCFVKVCRLSLARSPCALTAPHWLHVRVVLQECKLMACVNSKREMFVCAGLPSPRQVLGKRVADFGLVHRARGWQCFSVKWSTELFTLGMYNFGSASSGRWSVSSQKS